MRPEPLVGERNPYGRSRVLWCQLAGAPFGPPPVEAQELDLVSSPQARQTVLFLSSGIVPAKRRLPAQPATRPPAATE